jgi:hypothetical protein
MDLTVQDKKTPTIEPLPKGGKGKGKGKKTKAMAQAKGEVSAAVSEKEQLMADEAHKKEHEKKEKRKAGLAKARAAQKLKREMKQKQEEEDRVGMKTLHGLVQGLHERLDSMEKTRLYEQKQEPVKVQPVDTPLQAPKPPPLPKMETPTIFTQSRRTFEPLYKQPEEKTGIARFLSESVQF